MVEAPLTQSLINSSGEHVALLDKEGAIIAVSQGWRVYAQQNGGQDSAYLGVNYLEVCQRASAEGSRDAQATLSGLREILQKDRAHFQLEYPCHSPSQQRWFEVLVTPLEEGALVAHYEVTERKRRELSSTTSERWLKSVFGLDTALYILSADAKVLFFNPKAQALAKRFRKKTLSFGIPFSQLVPGPFRPSFFKSFKQALSGTPVHQERRVSGVWLEVKYQPIFEQAEVREVSLSFKDISARKQTRTALPDQHALLRHTEQLPVAVAAWDTQRVITAWNPAAERLFGSPASQVLGTRADALFEGVPAEAILAGAALNPVTMTHAHPRGPALSCDWLSAPLLDERGNEVGTLAFAQNVSERGALAQALHASQEQFARVFANSPAPMLIVSASELRVTDVNTPFLALTQYSRSELLGQLLADLSLWPYLPTSKLHASPDRSRRVLTEQPLRTRSGLWHTVLMNTENVEYEDEPCLLISCVDMTQLQRTEEELLRAFKEVLQETTWFGRAVLEKLAQYHSVKPSASGVLELTRREREVLSLMAQGKDNEEIAATLGIVHQTVRNYVTRIYDKLNVHSRAEAVIWARERGLGTP